MSDFVLSKNNAAARLEHLLDHGTDPSEVPAAGNAGSKRAVPTARNEAEAVDEAEMATDIEEVVYDRITARISEDLAGHNLATLVTPPLLSLTGPNVRKPRQALTATLTSSPTRGVLGLDNPILVR